MGALTTELSTHNGRQHEDLLFLGLCSCKRRVHAADAASLLGSCGDPVFDDILSGYVLVVRLTRAEASKMVKVKLTH